MLGGSSGSTDYAYAKFASRRQAQGNTNDCGSGEFPFNVGCQNTNSQIQGDENAFASTAQQTFPEVKIDQEEPPVNTVFVSWVESANKILSKRSTDGGSTFGNNFDLSNDASCCAMPSAASFENNVYVVWSSDDSIQDDILFKKSTDGGATFGSEINISNTPTRSFQPAMAVSGSNLYVVWSDGTPDNHDILLKKSTNGGASFGSVINLSDELGGNLP
jgi:hypothetical protein